ncbi:MAG TPA: ATP-binding protein [Candidatus Hydrogenedentes bacterium]|nr:ATP-binding protein [Candidatus Hydrogenedentota bacterium]HPG68138.1 ATP-binding protein [Candidatus Hydrogenedentota bacterium]
MLIEFSVANFRSIHKRQTLSLVANNRDGELPDNCIELDVPGLANTRLLRSAIIYGANASGKSNIVRSMDFMSEFVAESAVRLKPGSKTGVVPFRLDTQAAQSPSEFEVHFIHNQIRYQYGFTLDSQRVHTEYLVSYPRGRARELFRRELVIRGTASEHKWHFSPRYLSGDKQMLVSATRPNALFLSTGAQLNHEDLGAVYEWFTDGLYVLECRNWLEMSRARDHAAELLLHSHGDRAVVESLRQADLGILDVHVEEEWVDPPGSLQRRIAEDLPSSKMEQFQDALKMKRLKLTWLHRGTGDPNGIPFETEEESDGTIKFLSFLGLWHSMLHANQAVVIDEIAAGMHPLLVRDLLNALRGPEVSSSSAQLVLTTHDTTLLDQSLFRRDQIWFTEKDKTGATTLYPLTDFKPRNKEALQKGYLAGRYGAIPFIEGDFTF